VWGPMQIEKLKLAELSTDPANARKHGPRNIDTIVGSLRRFGQQKPIVIDSSGVVRAGNGTLEAARLLGWETIDVIRTGLKGSEATAYAIADNRTAELAEWDDDILAATLQGLVTDDEELLALAGFDQAELDALLNEISGDGTTGEIEEDEVPEPPVDPITKPGDLWILGEHRVLCGDSTKAEDVARLMGGKKAGSLVTDPPYGINASKMTMGSSQSSKKKADRLSNVAEWDSVRPNVSWMLSAADFVCIWGGNYFSDQLPVSNDWLCWWKNNDNLSFSEFELAWTNSGKNTRHLQRHWSGEEKLHITAKPVAVMVWAIGFGEGLIYDPFLGSGTTLIAAEQLGRKCYGMEISPAYCDVIVKRWENLTGKKAVLSADP